MIKKRTRPQPRVREISPEAEEVPSNSAREKGEEQLDISELLELQKLRKSGAGIDITKLNKGVTKKKPKKVAEEDTGEYGLRPGTGPGPAEDDEGEAKARRVVRTNNFTKQTNALDVDKHMMAYIEDNMKIRRGEVTEEGSEDTSADPYAELFEKSKRSKEKEEGNVTNSLAMLTAIPEVDLGMDNRLKNIEDTEKAKRVLNETKGERKPQNPEAHLVATRFYQPNLKQKSDADIMRDAKMEAMGLRPEDHEPPKHKQSRMATDDVVMERFKKRMRK